MSTKVELAAALAKHFHAGQKYGKYDYFSHHLCGVVAYVKDNYTEDMSFTLEDAVCVAYLHDILEDTSMTDSIIWSIFGGNIAYNVKLLTKVSCETRNEYLMAVKENRLSTYVKICDAEFNRDQSIADGDEKRAKYYQDTIDYLKGEIL